MAEETTDALKLGLSEAFNILGPIIGGDDPECLKRPLTERERQAVRRLGREVVRQTAETIRNNNAESP